MSQDSAVPSAIRARDGRLWVATARGVAVVDPQASTRNPVPPPVHVEEALIDGDRAPDGPLRVPPGAQRVELRYTALGLRAPERVTFRYLLEGYDRDWVEARGNRVAQYTRLAPGKYTFRVIAANEDGVRSKGEARLGVTVDPRWFETWWARLLAVALVAAAVWGAVRLHFAAKLEDANRRLAIANERLRGLSYVDGLTGVANRRRFDEALEEACAAARNQGTPISLVLIDLDHFKQLNDSQGHQIGDEALRAVAALLAERTESRGGLVARFGGEEFAWLLPGVALDAAKAEAEAFRMLVRQQGVITASLGVAASDGTAALTPLSLVEWKPSADAPPPTGTRRDRSRAYDALQTRGAIASQVAVATIGMVMLVRLLTDHLRTQVPNPAGDANSRTLSSCWHRHRAIAWSTNKGVRTSCGMWR